ncbi:MAG: nucleoside-diphosphate sugar epimerase, partial [Burkholderiaceae bacterium]
MPTAPPLRTALLAGATGLIGRELLARLGADPTYGKIHVWQRRQSSAGALPASTKIKFHTVDFAHPPPAPQPLDDVYIALGTTIKVAGSQAAFRAVDHAYVLAAASSACAAGATRLAVVSALGADAKSSIFYNCVKGEMQQAVAQLGFASVVIAQPSLLIGDRAALGQPVRNGEVWAV